MHFIKNFIVGSYVILGIFEKETSFFAFLVNFMLYRRIIAAVTRNNGVFYGSHLIH